MKEHLKTDNTGQLHLLWSILWPLLDALLQIRDGNALQHQLGHFSRRSLLGSILFSASVSGSRGGKALGEQVLSVRFSAGCVS